MVDWLIAVITLWFSIEFVFFSYRFAKLRPTTYSVDHTAIRVVMLAIALWFLLVRLIGGGPL